MSTSWCNFVKGMRHSLKPKKKTIVHAVIGNEASDVDSIVSALITAFSLTQEENPQPLRTAIQRRYPEFDHVFVPVLNISPDSTENWRSDLDLRQDAQYILKQLQINPSQLVYAKGQGPLSSASALQHLHQNDTLRVVLVDHNACKGFNFCIEAIIDHHQESNAHLDTVLPGFRNIQPTAGSTCSLVAQDIVDAGQGHILTANGGQLAWALASVILLDTNAMNKQTNVVGPIDQVQCPSLCSSAGIVDPKSHYRLVLNLRSCMTGFSVTDKLRKDYKEWMLPFPNQNASGTEPESLSYGIATIVSNFYDLTKSDTGQDSGIKNDDLTNSSLEKTLEAMRFYASKMKLHVLAVMFVVIKPTGLQRQLLVHVPTASTQSISLDFSKVLASIHAELELVPLEFSPSTKDCDNQTKNTANLHDFALFHQCNPRLSRKKIQPALQKALSMVLEARVTNVLP